MAPHLDDDRDRLRELFHAGVAESGRVLGGLLAPATSPPKDRSRHDVTHASTDATKQGPRQASALPTFSS